MLMTSDDVQRVTYGELEQIPAPEPTARWHPVPHGRILGTVLENLDLLGFSVTSMDLAVSHQGQRFFGTIDLGSDLSEGVNLVVGLRNSTDKSYSAALVAGSRVAVCSNGMFSGEISVTRKHTAKIEQDFDGGVLHAIKSLRSFREGEVNRIGEMQQLQLSDERAAHLVLTAHEKKIVGSRMLMPLWNEWKEPSFEEFRPRTAWSLMNAMTTVWRERMKQRPIEAAMETMQMRNHVIAA